MAPLLRLVYLLAALACFTTSFVRADEEEDDYDDEEYADEGEEEVEYDDGEGYGHPLTDMPSESDEVTVRHQFIKHEPTDEAFPLGSVLSVLIGVVNQSPEDYNVTFAMGSINHPVDLAFYIQNLTLLHFNTTLRPNSEYTFQYDFYPNPQNLDVDSSYQLALTVFYENEMEFFADTFFNGTVNFQEVETEGVQSMGLYLVLAGLVATAFQYMSSGKSSSSSSETGVVGKDKGYGEVRETAKKQKKSGGDPKLYARKRKKKKKKKSSKKSSAKTE